MTPDSCLRHWCSFKYLRISPLHLKFHYPLINSSDPVSNAVPEVEPGAFTSDLNRPPTRALRPVIPINARTLRITAAAGTELAGASSEGNVTDSIRLLTVTHFLPTESALQPEGLLHTRGMAAIRLAPIVAIFPTAASRRSPGRVSVPVWLIILSDQLWIVALVGLYPTNKLIQREAHLIARGPKVPRFPP